MIASRRQMGARLRDTGTRVDTVKWKTSQDPEDGDNKINVRLN